MQKLEVGHGWYSSAIVLYTMSICIHAGCPTMLRGDYGTENCILAATKIAFHLPHVDRLAGSKSFLYGPSTRNIVFTRSYSY